MTKNGEKSEKLGGGIYEPFCFEAQESIRSISHALDDEIDYQVYWIIQSYFSD